MIGKQATRVEDDRLLTGNASYIDNLPISAGTGHAAILRSPYPHAKIISINYDKALDIHGVKGIITGKDIKKHLKPFSVGVSEPVKYYPLAIDKVRYVGEPVALVVATDRYVAEDALELIEIEYEQLSPLVDIEESLNSENVLLHENMTSNIA